MSRGAARLDPIHVIEAAYRVALPEQTWLQGIADALRSLERGAGVSVLLAQLASASSRLVRSFAAAGALAFDPSLVEAWSDRLPVEVCRALFAPGETAIFSADFVAAKLSRFGLTVPRIESAIGAALPVAWGTIGGSPAGEVAFLSVYVRDRSELGRTQRLVLASLGRHLGTALRLRRLLDQTQPEAVLAPDGRVLHVSEPLSGRARRSALSDAVRRIDRARGRLRRERPDEAVALWRALFEGHWSILEHEERDGRRVMVVRRNEPGAAEVASISPEERPVVLLAALGHSFKSMSYELGVAPATLHARLARAMRTLGVSSRAELVRVYGPIVAGIGRVS